MLKNTANRTETITSKELREELTAIEDTAAIVVQLKLIADDAQSNEWLDVDRGITIAMVSNLWRRSAGYSPIVTGCFVQIPIEFDRD